jgi:hypothetical protein
VFGPVKSKGGVKRRRFYFDHRGAACTREIATALLLESWQEVSDSLILAGWDFDETLRKLDDLDSSDNDEFVLRMMAVSDDDELSNSWLEECDPE